MSDQLSPFQNRLREQGAVFTKDVADSIRTIEFGPDGFPLVPAFEPLGPPNEAVHFGNARAEYRATTRAAVFDLSHRGHLELIGADRQKFLNGFCTADVKKLQPGEGCEAFIPNIKGKVLAHVFVFAAESSLWLETVADSVQPLMGHLERYVITEDVKLFPRTNEVGELYLSGPETFDTLATLGVDVSSWPLCGHQPATFGETPVTVRRVDWLQSPGCLVLTAREHLSACWDQLVTAGARPAGAAVFNALRIQAGLPLYGIDVTEDQLAQEVARTPLAISFTKGCYLGQEPIARIDALGHVNRELRGLKLEASFVPTLGQAVTDADGKEIGRLTSYAMLPDEKVPVALATLRREFATPGTQVFVRYDDDALPAHVFWPFAN